MNRGEDEDLRHLEELLAMDESDPRRVRALQSVRMRNLLRDYQQFESGSTEVDAAELEDAMSRLQSMTIGETAPARSPAPRRSSRWRSLTLAASVASVAVLAVLGPRLFAPGPSREIPVLRDGDTDAVEDLGLRMAREQDALVLDWEGVRGANAYELVVYGSDLRELDRIALGPTSPARVDLSPYLERGPLGARISALGEGRELLRSPMRPVPTAAETDPRN